MKLSSEFTEIRDLARATPKAKQDEAWGVGGMLDRASPSDAQILKHDTGTGHRVPVYVGVRLRSCSQHSASGCL